MQFRNSEKLKKNINIELENRINNHKKNYYLQLNAYNRKFLKYENHIKGKSTLDKEDNYNICDKGTLLFNHIEDKSIKGNISKDLNIISYVKLEYNDFKRCKFKDVIFKDCIFNGNIFSKCIFENVLFENCGFYRLDNINIFSDDCIFIKTIFKNCNLENSVFKECRINDLKFIESNLENTIFSNMIINNNQISDCDCRGIKIINSSIEKLKFEDKNITRLDEYVFIDNIRIDKKYKKSYEEVAKVYKNIAKKLEENNLINCASEYYYLSKCIENRALTGIDKIKSTIYWLLCGYGERPTYALITSLEIIFVFAVIYMFTGLSINGATVNYMEAFSYGLAERNVITDFMSSLYFSMVTFTTVGYGDITPLNLSIFLSGVEMFLGLTMMGIWTATLARKIIR